MTKKKMASPQEEAESGLNATSQKSGPNLSKNTATKLKSKLVPLERGKWLNTTSKTYFSKATPIKVNSP
jgi:hypothetical protein